MASVFISMTGTQIMGTLQVWLACSQSHGTDKAVLLYTDETKKATEKLSSIARDFSLGDVETFPISTRIDGPGNAPDMVRQIVAATAERHDLVCFNLDGGMNYLICACALAIAEFHPLLMQFSRSRYIECDLKNNEFYQCKNPKVFPVEDILKLQEVPYTIEKTNPDAFRGY